MINWQCRFISGESPALATHCAPPLPPCYAEHWPQSGVERGRGHDLTSWIGFKSISNQNDDTNPPE